MRRRVLITGGSDGIGRCLVTCFVDQGWDVVCTGRRARDEIAEPLPADVHYLQLDHAAGAATAEVMAAIGEGPLHLAVVNAALGLYGPLAGQTPAALAQMMAVNVTGALLLARALYPNLSAAQGQVTFIGSTAARGRHPEFAAYAASKAALHGAARSLRHEWAGKVHVQVLHPGPTATDMHSKVGLDPGRARRFFTRPEAMAASLARATQLPGWHYRFGAFYTLRKALFG